MSQNWSTDFSSYSGGSILKAGVICEVSFRDYSFHYSESIADSFLAVTMLFTLTIWTICAFLLLVAGILYVPLLCYIQGNLKEYCCHKADKRISELMKRKNRKRLAKEAEIAKKEARGDFSHLKDKKGNFVSRPIVIYEIIVLTSTILNPSRLARPYLSLRYLRLDYQTTTCTGMNPRWEV